MTDGWKSHGAASREMRNGIWRNKAGEAPIKETLANAMAALSFWRPERPLVDPFCGSGTILIEAVLREMHVAPGISRDFVCKYWPQVSKDMWQ